MTTDTPNAAGARSVWLQPQPGDHYHDLPHAQLMDTRATRTLRQNLDIVVPGRGILCVHGHPGLGKTLSVKSTLRDIAATDGDVAAGTLHVPYGENPSASYLQEMLYYALALPGDPPRSRAVRELRILEALSSGFHLLIFDEAQWLTRPALNYLWQLWDARQTKNKLAAVLIGAETCYRKIESHQPLASRILALQPFSPLTPTEVLKIIPEYHPLWHDTGQDDLLWTNDLVCHGNFRNWAKMTYHLHTAIQNNPGTTTTRELIRWVAKKMNGPTTT